MLALVFLPIVAGIIWLVWELCRDLRRPRCRDCGALIADGHTRCEACLKVQIRALRQQIAQVHAEPPTPDADRLLRSLEDQT